MATLRTLIREYQEGTQVMQEFEVTTESGKTHIVRVPIVREPTKEEKLEQIRQEYLILIRDARDLGEDAEVIRLQQEYQLKKAEIEAE